MTIKEMYEGNMFDFKEDDYVIGDCNRNIASSFLLATSFMDCYDDEVIGMRPMVDRNGKPYLKIYVEERK